MCLQILKESHHLLVLLADGHRSQREDVRGRLTDIVVYCLLFWGMVEDNNNKEQGENNNG